MTAAQERHYRSLIDRIAGRDSTPEGPEESSSDYVDTFLDSFEHPDNIKLSNSLHQPGAKDDSAKYLAGVLGDFSNALKQVARVGTYGARKYTRKGWESVEDAETRYYDAFWRHILDMEGNIEMCDFEHGERHLAAIAWNALALLELLDRKNKDESPSHEA
jgi:hypothetical protein